VVDVREADKRVAVVEDEEVAPRALPERPDAGNDAIPEAWRPDGLGHTLRNRLLRGGLGSYVAMSVAANHPTHMRFIGLDDTYAESGKPEELLEKYGWYLKNSKGRSWPVGSMKPNDLGLFDLYGNALEWCQDPLFLYPPSTRSRPVPDIVYKEDMKYISDRLIRVLRGGAFTLQPGFVCSANRNRIAPALRPSPTR